MANKKKQNELSDSNHEIGLYQIDDTAICVNVIFNSFKKNL